jgi:hypothetical protein
MFPASMTVVAGLLFVVASFRRDAVSAPLVLAGTLVASVVVRAATSLFNYWEMYRSGVVPSGLAQYLSGELVASLIAPGPWIVGISYSALAWTAMTRGTDAARAWRYAGLWLSGIATVALTAASSTMRWVSLAASEYGEPFAPRTTVESGISVPFLFAASFGGLALICGIGMLVLSPWLASERAPQD